LSGLGLVSGSTFVQLTDIHVDPEYSQNCKTGSHHEFGSRGWKCDSPLVLLDEALKFIGSLNPKPDFILMSGDIHRHSKEKEDAVLLDSFEMVGGKLQQLGIPIVPAIGNNDLPSHNQLAGAPNPDIDLLSKAFFPLLQNKKERKVFRRRGGYYSRKLSGRMSAIALNTNYFIKPNKAAGDCDQDSPGIQFTHPFFGCNFVTMMARKVVAAVGGGGGVAAAVVVIYRSKTVQMAQISVKASTR